MVRWFRLLSCVVVVLTISQVAMGGFWKEFTKPFREPLKVARSFQHHTIHKDGRTRKALRKFDKKVVQKVEKEVGDFLEKYGPDNGVQFGYDNQGNVATGGADASHPYYNVGSVSPDKPKSKKPSATPKPNPNNVVAVNAASIQEQRKFDATMANLDRRATELSKERAKLQIEELPPLETKRDQLGDGFCDVWSSVTANAACYAIGVPGPWCSVPTKAVTTTACNKFIESNTPINSKITKIEERTQRIDQELDQIRIDKAYQKRLREEKKAQTKPRPISPTATAKSNPKR